MAKAEGRLQHLSQQEGDTDWAARAPAQTYQGGLHYQKVTQGLGGITVFTVNGKQTMPFITERHCSCKCLLWTQAWAIAQLKNWWHLAVLASLSWTCRHDVWPRAYCILPSGRRVEMSHWGSEGHCGLYKQVVEKIRHKMKLFVLIKTPGEKSFLAKSLRLSQTRPISRGWKQCSQSTVLIHWLKLYLEYYIHSWVSYFTLEHSIYYIKFKWLKRIRTISRHMKFKFQCQ